MSLNIGSVKREVSQIATLESTALIPKASVIKGTFEEAVQINGKHACRQYGQY